MYKIKQTGLQLACTRKDLKLIKTLLNIDTVDVNEENFCGETALDMMCRKGETNIANMLLDAGAKLKLRDYSQLAHNIFTRHDIPTLTALRFLAQLGINAHNVNRDNETLIHVACRCDDLESLKMLNNSIKELNIQNRVGETALHIAARKRNLELLKYLIDSGIDLNIQNNLGQTALHVAFEQEDYPCVKELIDAGARLDIGDVGKRKPLDLNVSNNFFALQIFKLNLANLKFYCESSDFNNVRQFLVENHLNIYKILAVKYILESKEKLSVRYFNKKHKLLKDIMSKMDINHGLRWAISYKDYRVFHYILRNGDLTLNDIEAKFGQDDTLISYANKVNPNAVEYLEAMRVSLEEKYGARNKHIGLVDLNRINERRILSKGL